ncbi:MAG: tRNA pseudouridine(38-40) synthase TruA [bacterium]|nr:tRNA pseudouridine(38-40) synthase TruA [Candidatus Kapabacteria bacterium]
MPTQHDDSANAQATSSRRIALQVAYDGTDFLGWQRQASGRTVQVTIETMLARLAGDEYVAVTGAGRTDSGVHAEAQVAHADIATEMNDAALLHALGRMSPPDISINKLATVDVTFHARFTACRRSYRYTIMKRADPFRARYAWQYDAHLDIDLLANAAMTLHGAHDFTALSKRNPDTPNSVCTVESATWRDVGDAFIFEVTADRFLYGMVRMLVGIQLDVARGRRALDDIVRAIESRDRGNQSQAAPAHGLALISVGYPDGGPF